MEFFSLFYQVNVYGQDLFYHLKGWDSGLQEFVEANNQFPTIWSIAFFSALVMYLLYYVVLNHPRLNRTWIWACFMGALILGVFLTSRSMVVADIVGNSLYPVDPQLSVSTSNATMFGVYNGLLSALFFFLLSVVGRVAGRNVKNVPFKSLINLK